MQKKGFFYLHKTRGADVARKATWQRHADPRAEVTRTRDKTTRVHANTRVVPRGSVRGAGRWRAHGLMGPS